MIDINIPEKLLFLFTEKSRFKVLHGGRGSGKSTGIAIALLLFSMQRKLRILCVREFQNSISESVHKLLCDLIELYKLEKFFNTTNNKITCLKTGSEFIFSGIKTNATKIKSMQGIDYCWVEEGQTISQFSLDILIPTIRNEGSEIWFSLNPMYDDDPVYKRFIINSDNRAIIAQVNFSDNPWFPKELQDEMEQEKLLDYDKYLNVWMGECIKHTDSIVFNKKWRLEEFKPKNMWNGPYYGLDFGFANDPAALVKSWVYDNVLYIEKDWAQKGVDIDLLALKLKEVDQEIDKYKIRADNSRPESISLLQKLGIPGVVGCKKWPGSVQDGISVLRSFKEIIVHPNCKSVAYEMSRYSFKVDKLTGDIKPDLQDKDNHCIDALRYALEPIITQKRPATLTIY